MVWAVGEEVARGEGGLGVVVVGDFLCELSAYDWV